MRTHRSLYCLQNSGDHHFAKSGLLQQLQQPVNSPHHSWESSESSRSSHYWEVGEHVGKIPEFAAALALGCQSFLSCFQRQSAVSSSTAIAMFCKRHRLLKRKIKRNQWLWSQKLATGKLRTSNNFMHGNKLNNFFQQTFPFLFFYRIYVQTLVFNRHLLLEGLILLSFTYIKFLAFFSNTHPIKNSRRVY